jgi:hypothetical protein
MASDITLAVGDGARRMTYAELAAVRGISALSAERLVRRKHWPRQVGNDGIVHVLVPLTEARKVVVTRRVSSAGQPRTPWKGQPLVFLAALRIRSSSPSGKNQ